MKKRLSKLTMVAALALAIFALLPAAYAAEAAGEVAGTVNLAAPGIPLTGCANTNYNFQDVVLRGVLRANNGTVFTGSLDTSNVKGNSTICESTSQGAGVVNSSLDPATFTSVAGPGTTGSAQGTFFGTYTRTESIVLVSLQVTFSINGGASQTATINVRAQFTPTAVSPSGITAANFIGGWSTF